MKDFVNGKVCNTDSSRLVKFDMSVEELGDGYRRYVSKSIMQRPREFDYFIWVVKVTTDRYCGILDRSEFVLPVEESYVKSFRRGMPDIFPD